MFPRRGEHLERDRHLLYARSLGLLSFETKKWNEREDYFGSSVTITPTGIKYLEEHGKTWWQKQMAALAQNSLTILISVLIALLSAWLLQLTGLSR